MTTVDIKKYKVSLITDIINNAKIVEGIASQSSEYIEGQPDTLSGANIFPYLRIPDTQNKADTYILVAVDLNGNSYNRTFANMRVTIWAMSHQDIMMMEDGNASRIDYLGEELRAMFDGSDAYGYGVLQCMSSAEHILNDKYQYRELIFITADMKISAKNKMGAYST